MKNSKGITLITLVVTIFILLLLSSTLILSSRGTYSIIKLQNFISKMKIIQAKVDELSESDSYIPPNILKIKESNINYNVFLRIFNELKNQGKLPNDDVLNNYYCFEPNDLKNELGIKDVNITVIINFNTRNVIALKGVTMDGVTYYRQYDIDSGENLMN